MSDKMLRANSNGFSLVELMVVVAIIAILAALAVPQYGKFRARAKQSEAQTTLGFIYTLEQAYFGDNNAYLAVATYGRGGACATNADAQNLGLTMPNCANLLYGYTVDTTAAPIVSRATTERVNINPSCTAGVDEVWTIDIDGGNSGTITKPTAANDASKC